MGLDQYAWAAMNPDARSEWLEHEYGGAPQPTTMKPRDLAYWRKHPNLEGWMEALWVSRGKPMLDGSKPPAESDWGSGFNGIVLELTWQDLDNLERAVLESKLPATTGFFFGKSADEHYREQDLQFIRDARAEIFTGLRVFYKSSW